MTHDDPQYPAYAPETELDQAIGRIAQAVFDYRAEFLFGAGMSVDCGVASGAQLAREMLESFFPSPTKAPTDSDLAQLVHDYPLEAVAEALQRRPGKGRVDLTTLVDGILGTTAAVPGDAHDIFLSRYE